MNEEGVKTMLTERADQVSVGPAAVERVRECSSLLYLGPFLHRVSGGGNGSACWRVFSACARGFSVYGRRREWDNVKEHARWPPPQRRVQRRGARER